MCPIPRLRRLSVSNFRSFPAEVRLSLIAAVGENGVIGVSGGMAWHVPSDFRHFKETTMGHVLVMGRTTFAGIGPLPGRKIIVLSRASTMDLPTEAVQARSWAEAGELVTAAVSDGWPKTVYIAGGAEIYRAALPFADELLISEIPLSPEGDAYFPAIPHDWQVVFREARDGFVLLRYERKQK